MDQDDKWHEIHQAAVEILTVFDRHGLDPAGAMCAITQIASIVLWAASERKNDVDDTVDIMKTMVQRNLTALADNASAH